MDKNKVLISLCMIVKNEQENLKRCLDSVQNQVDEIILVDTGSTDNTVNIAGQYGARIFNYKWNNDFSKVRNFALQQARGKWILVLDADHVLIVEAGNKLASIVDNQDSLGFMLDENLIQDGKNVRTLERLLLFKNKPGFRYEGVIDEEVEDAIIQYAGLKDIKEPVSLLKNVFVNKIRKKNYDVLLQRNNIILEQAIINEPDNYSYYFKRLVVLKQLGKDDEFKAILLKAIYRIEQKNPPLDESVVGIWGLFGDWVIEDNNGDKIETFYINAGLINKQTKWNDIRLVWPYVKVSIMQKKYDQAIFDLTRCIKNGLVPSQINITTEEKIIPVVLEELKKL